MITFETMIDTFRTKFKSVTVIEPSDIPNIDLYMDQVTTFMERMLAPYKRTPDAKILTKTMINNYTKGKILPPPIKKKYTSTHIMLLIMIFHLKNILSMRDIATLLRPMISASSPELTQKQVAHVYGGFVALQKATISYIQYSPEEQQQNPMPERAVFSNYDEHTKKILLVLLLAIRANAEKYLTERVLDLYF